MFFLESIRALRFYVKSVEENIDSSLSEEAMKNENALYAFMIFLVIKSKKNGIDIINELQRSDEVPERTVTFFRDAVSRAENFIQEKEIDGKKVYKYRYLPKSIKKEYQKFEVEEKQQEILYSGFLMLLVTYFENLVAGVLKKDFIKYPKRISLDEKSVSYKLLSEIGDIEEIKSILIDQEVTNKMYESLDDWKKYFQKCLKLKLRSWDEKYDELKEIIARRNLYVHNNGIINNIYVKSVNNIKREDIGENIGINREYIDNAINIIEYVGISLVIEIWVKEYAEDEDEVKNITNMIYEEYLETERWEMAKHFYEICIENKKLSTADEILCKINSWQCYKWLGEYDKIKDEVEKIDLSAYKPMYTLGILALKEDYKKFFEFYDEQTDIGEAELKEWPLFIELRKSEEYMERFPEIEDVERVELQDTEEVAN